MNKNAKITNRLYTEDIQRVQEDNYFRKICPGVAQKYVHHGSLSGPSNVKHTTKG